MVDAVRVSCFCWRCKSVHGVSMAFCCLHCPHWVKIRESQHHTFQSHHFQWSHSYSVIPSIYVYTYHCHDHTLTAWCPHHTFLERVYGFFQSGWGIGWRWLGPKSRCNLTVVRDKHWIAAVRVVGKQSASLVCFWDSYIYIYYTYIIYTKERVIVRYFMFTIALDWKHVYI